MANKLSQRAIEKAREADPSFKNDMGRVAYRNSEPVKYELITDILEELKSKSSKSLSKTTSITFFLNLPPSGEDFRKLDTEMRIREAFLKQLHDEGYIKSLAIYLETIPDDEGPYDTDAYFASFSCIPLKIIAFLQSSKESLEKNLLVNKNGLSILGIKTDTASIYYKGQDFPLGGGLHTMFILLTKDLVETEEGFEGEPVKLSVLTKEGNYTAKTIRSNLTKLRFALKPLTGLGLEFSITKGTSPNTQILKIKRLSK